MATIDDLVPIPFLELTKEAGLNLILRIRESRRQCKKATAFKQRKTVSRLDKLLQVISELSEYDREKLKNILRESR